MGYKLKNKELERVCKQTNLHLKFCTDMLEKIFDTEKEDETRYKHNAKRFRLATSIIKEANASAVITLKVRNDYRETVKFIENRGK
jgi:hypothetical protein